MWPLDAAAASGALLGQHGVEHLDHEPLLGLGKLADGLDLALSG